jgi:hypothetical protein
MCRNRTSEGSAVNHEHAVNSTRSVLSRNAYVVGAVCLLEVTHVVSVPGKAEAMVLTAIVGIVTIGLVAIVAIAYRHKVTCCARLHGGVLQM